MCALFRHPRECVRLGAEGRRAYEALRDFDQRSAYHELLDDLALPAAESRLLAPAAALITKVVQTFAEHSVMGLFRLALRALSRG